jgi:hypothetical protein
MVRYSVSGQSHVTAVPLSSLSKLSSLVWLQTCFNIIEHFHEVVDNAASLPSISAICDRQFPSIYLKSLGRRPFIQTNKFEYKTSNFRPNMKTERQRDNFPIGCPRVELFFAVLFTHCCYRQLHTSN